MSYCRKCTSRFLYLIIVILLPIDAARAQIPVPENITKTVTFLFATDGKNASVGTGFYINIHGEPDTVTLVTAKHVFKEKLETIIQLSACG